MASTPRRSLLSRATGAAKKVTSRSTAATASAAPAKKAAKAAGSKAAPAAKKTASATAKKATPAAKKTAAAAAKKAPAAANKTAAVAKKTPSAAKKTAAVAKKTPAAAKKTAAVAKKTTAAAKKTAVVAKKTSSAAKKTTAATRTAAAKVPAAKPAKAIAKKAVAASRASANAAATRNAGKLVVLEQEDPWTAAELSEVRSQLKADIVRLKDELRVVESDLDGLMRASGEGAGNDQADVGSASFERDQEMTIANNAREMLAQTEHALERIANKSYGVCENCGNPIGKNRLMAFPRATLCMTCKQREERR